MSEQNYQRLVTRIQNGLDAAGELFSLLEERGVHGRAIVKHWSDSQWPVECSFPESLEELMQNIQAEAGGAA